MYMFSIIFGVRLTVAAMKYRFKLRWVYHGEVLDSHVLRRRLASSNVVQITHDVESAMMPVLR